MATLRRHLHAEPAVMSSNYELPNTSMSDRVYGQHHTDANVIMSESICTRHYGAVDNNSEHLRQERYQPNEHQFASFSNQPVESDQRSKPDCDGSHHAYADCLSTSASSGSVGNESSGVRTPEPNQHGNFRCPDSGKLCSSDVCDGWCKGDS